MSAHDAHAELESFLTSWCDTTTKPKATFLELNDLLASKTEVVLDFVSRPGISHSLRAKHRRQNERPLFAMIDIIDDDPAARWLSVCFYLEMISDPEERGNFVPEGLLGQDACCFDIDERDEGLIRYVCARLDEAYANAVMVESN
jgi:hypothetical protein